MSKPTVNLTLTTLDGDSDTTTVGAVEGVHLEREYGVTLEEAMDSGRLELIAFLGFIGCKRRKLLAADQAESFMEWLDTIDGMEVAVDNDPPTDAPAQRTE